MTMQEESVYNIRDCDESDLHMLNLFEFCYLRCNGTH